MSADLPRRLPWLALGAVADATILFSFGRSGYLIHRELFRRSDLDADLSGKICLVTGANAGLGRETAHGLARLGATVWLLCRNVERGRAALAQVRKVSGSARSHLAVMDVSSLASVRRFVEDFPADRVDVLVNNAGVLPPVRQESADGIELTFATNVVGPFLLTALLLPRLRAAKQARVINVSSGGMYAQRLDLSDWQWKRSPFDGVRAYALTKRAEVVLTEMWAERLARTNVTCNSMHPGWADTPGVETQIPRFHRLMRSMLRTPAEGADTILWLAACQRIAAESGKFWFDRAARRTHLLPWTRETAADRRRLWHLCCRLADIEEPGADPRTLARPAPRRA